MKLNEIPRTAAVSWCPCPLQTHLLATGSIAGSLGSDFSAEAKLEIFDSHKKKGGSSCDPLSTVTSKDRFNKLAWGNPNQEQYQYGVIAGALVDNSVGLWNPEKMINGDGENSLITLIDKHEAPVRALDFNPIQKSLLATAGEDSNLYVWNLKNVEKPNLFTLSGNNPHQNQSISALQWNRIYEYILGTASFQGTCAIWDLKQKRTLLTLTNSQKKKRYSSISWHPDLPTQLLLSSEDDETPVIELWDLKKAYAPVTELKGHTKGVLSISWCPDDSNLLLSCGKDNRNLIWNPNSGEILTELPSSENWMYDVQWSHNLAVSSTASFDGKINIYSLQDSGAESSGDSQDFSQKELGFSSKQNISKKVFKTAPKWLQRPSGASFSFGRLVSFSNTSAATKQENTPNKALVKIQNIVTDDEYSKRSEALENSIQENSLVSFCQLKAQGDEKENEKIIWGILSVLFSENKHEQILKYLGFNKEEISKQIEESLESDFENAEENIEDDIDESEEKPKEPIYSNTVDELIQKAVMVGDFNYAVKCCLKAGRTDDALVFAACGGPELWNSTRETYFSLQKRPIMKTISKLLSNKYEEIVDESDLNEWKKTLSLICTFGKNSFESLCNRLGERLEKEVSDEESAVVCYIASKNVKKTIQIWKNSLGEEYKQSDLLSFIEKVSVIQQLDLSVFQDHDLQMSMIPEYSKHSKIIAEQGLFESALRYLNIIDNVNALPEESNELRFRLYYSVSKPSGTAPKAPFTTVNVNVSQKAFQGKSANTQPERKATQNTQPSFNSQATNQFNNPSRNVTNNQYNNTSQFNRNNSFQTQSTFGMQANNSNTTMSQNQSQYQQPQFQQQSPYQQQPHHQQQQMQPSNTSANPMLGLPPRREITSSFDSQSIQPSVNQPSAMVQPRSINQPLEPNTNQPSQQLYQPSIPQDTTGTQQTSSSPFQPNNPTNALPSQTSSTPTFQPSVSNSPSKTPVLDTSDLEGDSKDVIDTLIQTYEEIYSGEVTSVLNAKKRMIQSSLNSLKENLQNNTVTPVVFEDLEKYTEAIRNGDNATLEEYSKKISVKHWDQTKKYSKGIKFITQILKQRK